MSKPKLEYLVEKTDFFHNEFPKIGKIITNVCLPCVHQSALATYFAKYWLFTMCCFLNLLDTLKTQVTGGVNHNK